MIPGAFALENCNELLPHHVRESLSVKARADADAGAPPQLHTLSTIGTTYFDGVLLEHQRLFYADVYEKRLARNQRRATT